MIRRAAGMLALGALVALVWALPALSHDAAYPSHITLREATPTFYKGRVTSDLGACEKHRLVKLYTAQGVDTSFRDTTDAEGRYEIDSGPGNHYYTRATRKVIDRAGHHHVCRTAVSDVV
jgi:hypothetical protein